MVMFAYHARLALNSLRRNPVLSSVMVLSLAIGISVWVTARAALAGAHDNPLAHRPALSLVTVERKPQWTDQLRDKRHLDIERFSRIFISYPELEALDRSAAPPRRTAAIDAQVVVSGADGTLHAASTTFASRDLFTMFDMPLTRGAPWSAAADAGAAREIVLDDDFATRLFGTADVVGREVTVNGASFTVVATLPRQLKHYTTSFLKTRFSDDVYLPLAWLRPLAVRPSLAYFQGDPGVTLEHLLRAPDRWLFYWVELPDAATRERFLADASAAGLRAHVEPFADALRVLNYVHPAYDLLYLFAQIALVAAALNLLRLLLAKFASRVAETGIHRAMGASRRSVLAQHVIESTIIGLIGGGLGLAIGSIDVLVMNALIPDRPGDAYIDGVAVLVTLGVAAVIGAITGGYSAWRATRLPPALFLRRA